MPEERSSALAHVEALGHHPCFSTTTMDFTEIYKQTSSLVEFSAGAHFIATAVQDRLIIRRADSFQITRTWLIDASPSATSVLMSSTKGKASSTGSEKLISHIGWSCDSEYLLAACAKSGTVQIFKLADEEWTAHIDSGAEGLVKAEWAPDGRNVLCFSEWGVRCLLATPPMSCFSSLLLSAPSNPVVTGHRSRKLPQLSYTPRQRYVNAQHDVYVTHFLPRVYLSGGWPVPNPC